VESLLYSTITTTIAIIAIIMPIQAIYWFSHHDNTILLGKVFNKLLQQPYQEENLA
jgi:uncharacterized membrane protein YfbV (UPF0208 family)